MIPTCPKADNYDVSGTETNVRLPFAAHDALTTIMARQGTSRDATLRNLLTDYVERQEQAHPDDRLTHISTVLCYPPPPRWRKDPRQDRPLRLRASPDLLDRARTLALRLPGQHRRAFRDYQGRQLTDAVMTAIARAEPFTDDFLDGMLPLLRQRAARSVWKLAAAVLCTGPERQLLAQATRVREATAWSTATLDKDSQHLLDVATALEDDVAWHSPARFHVAATIARDLLTGPQATANEQVLQEEGEAWEDLYQDTLHADGERRIHLRQGVPPYDWSGRGGGAVWRAHRHVGLHDFEDWLTGRIQPHTTTYTVRPPGWTLSRPPTWHAVAPPPTRTGHLPQPYAAWVSEGRVLAFPYRNRSALWPLETHHDPPGFQPAPGTSALLDAATSLRPDQVSAYIEALHIDWNREAEEPPGVPLTLDIPASKAYDFGLIDAQERQRAMAEAREATLHSMDKIINHFTKDEKNYRELLQVRGNVRAFARVASRVDSRLGAQFQTHKALWRWPGLSVLDEFHAGAPADLVEWLTTVAHDRSTLILEQSMQQAWNEAFERYRPKSDKKH